MKRTEHQEQAALFRVAALHEKKWPELAQMFAVPNGGQRHIAVAARLKAEGVKAGVPDIFLPAPRGQAHGLFIELKAEGGRVSAAQRNRLAALARQGYACRVCYGWEEAWREIQAYLAGPEQGRGAE